MDKVLYQKILFRTAMCVMACDGEIHDDEIRELELAFEQTGFFQKLIFKDELESAVNDFERDEKQVVIDYFALISSSSFNPVQRLQVLEIILRIIYADHRIDENELHFLRIVKSKLNVPDEIFYKRFGEVSGLHVNYSETKLVSETNNFLESITLPESPELLNILDDIS
mgnify:CR=1 FL=1